jgi:hypothetical protein
VLKRLVTLNIFHKNIANKKWYSLAKLIGDHRKSTYGKDVIDELTPETINGMFQMGLSNAINRKD